MLATGGSDPSHSGLTYFFERNNAEVPIKALDGCDTLRRRSGRPSDQGEAPC